MTGMTCWSSCASSMRESTSLKRTCAKCSHGSPIIPLTASRNYCYGTSQPPVPDPGPVCPVYLDIMYPYIRVMHLIGCLLLESRRSLHERISHVS